MGTLHLLAHVPCIYNDFEQNNASMTYVSRENNILNLCCCGRIRTYWEWSTNTMSINNVLS